jgi:hypothetical protein
LKTKQVVNHRYLKYKLWVNKHSTHFFLRDQNLLNITPSPTATHLFILIPAPTNNLIIPSFQIYIPKSHSNPSSLTLNPNPQNYSQLKITTFHSRHPSPNIIPSYLSPLPLLQLWSLSNQKPNSSLSLSLSLSLWPLASQVVENWARVITT